MVLILKKQKTYFNARDAKVVMKKIKRKGIRLRQSYDATGAKGRKTSCAKSASQNYLRHKLHTLCSRSLRRNGLVVNGSRRVTGFL